MGHRIIWEVRDHVWTFGLSLMDASCGCYTMPDVKHFPILQRVGRGSLQGNAGPKYGQDPQMFPTKLCHENSTSCADLTEPQFWRGVDERRPPAMQQWEGRLCHAGSSKTPQLQHAFEQVPTPAG